MAILNIIPDSASQLGVIPSFLYINTDDTAATVLTPGYLNPVSGQLGFNPTEKVALVATTDFGANFYQITQNGNTFSLSQAGVDTVNAVSPLASTGGYQPTISIASPIPLNLGGTNAALTASGGGIVYSTNSALGILSGTGTANQIVMSQTSPTAPIWSTATYPATVASGTVLGTSSTNAVTALTTLPSGVQGNITSVGTISSGVWNGTAIGPTHGGTGLTSTTINQLLYSSSNNTIAGLATTNSAALATTSGGAPQWLALTDGQLVIGSSTGAPTAGTITPGTGISVTNGHNSITIAATGTTTAWTKISAQSTAGASNIEFTGFDASIYRALFFDIQNIRAATNKVGIYFQLGSVGGGYVTTGTYIYIDITAGVTNALTKDGFTTQTEFHLTNDHAGVENDSSTKYLFGQVYLRGFNDATAPCSVMINSFYEGEWGSDDFITVNSQGRLANPGGGNTITKAKFYTSDASNIIGSITLYGILA